MPEMDFVGDLCGTSSNYDGPDYRPRILLFFTFRTDYNIYKYIYRVWAPAR